MTQTAFATYYTDHQDALFNFARKLTKDESRAEDLVQETAIKAFRGMHTFKVGTSFKSWSFTILKNTFISNYHRRRKRSVVSTSVEDLAFALEDQCIVTNDALSQMRLQEIKAEVAQLSKKSRIPFLMHVKGYQYSEIADKLSIPIGTVKSRISFARKKLKNRLQEYILSN